MVVSREDLDALTALCRDQTATPAHREKLIAACEAYGINTTNSESPARLRGKLSRWLRATERERHRAAEAERTERAEVERRERVEVERRASAQRLDEVENRVRRRRRAGAVLAVAVAATLFPWRPRHAAFDVAALRANVAASVRRAATADDAVEQIGAFLQSWASTRRRHVASLVIAGDARLIGAAFDSLQKAAARVLRARDVDGDTFRDFVARDDRTLVLLSDVRTPPAYAEDLVDIHLASDHLHRAAVVWAFEPPALTSCCDAFLRARPPYDHDGPTVARRLFQQRFASALPPAFYNRILHAALLCPTD